MTTETNAPADAELKAKHRTMWASGDYPGMVTDFLTPLGTVLVEAAGVGSGDRVLDVAAGTGNAAIAAAVAGGDVVASDLTPELFDAGRREADARGVRLDWREADAEHLPFDDASFDVVMSCIGVMFAPHHQEAADELVRVTRPDGTIGLLSWTPPGLVGQLFAALKPYAPPPPPGAQPPPRWGDEGHVRELLGDRVTDVQASTGSLRVELFATGAEFRDYFKERYGPTRAVYTFIGDDAERVAALDAALAEVGDRFIDGGVSHWEYLLVTARRR
ncbi:class I SAM-dependent methyltransferase [Nocardioides sp.]|uniref:class I SAM-dependent methyltransferase n=1 Tax=Nocardioides sp. TaxID=35761 RepID=UPI002ED67720